MAIILNNFVHFNLNLSQMSPLQRLLSEHLKSKFLKGSMRCVTPIRSQEVAVQNSIENPELLNQKVSQCVQKLVNRSSSI